MNSGRYPWPTGDSVQPSARWGIDQSMGACRCSNELCGRRVTKIPEKADLQKTKCPECKREGTLRRII